MFRPFLAAFAISLAPASAFAADATADMIGLNGNSMGTVTLTATDSGVLLNARIEGISEGPHGFHIHETGTCEPGEAFKTAGGHLAEGKQHGFLVEGGPHPGDMPNVEVGADGVFQTEVFNTRVALDDSSLLRPGGTAVMVHSGADDYTSQPAGAAGDRVACGVIKAAN